MAVALCDGVGRLIVALMALKDASAAVESVALTEMVVCVVIVDDVRVVAAPI